MLSRRKNCFHTKFVVFVDVVCILPEEANLCVYIYLCTLCDTCFVFFACSLHLDVLIRWIGCRLKVKTDIR